MTLWLRSHRHENLWNKDCWNLLKFQLTSSLILMKEMSNLLDHTCMASHSRRGLRWQSQRQGFRLRINWNVQVSSNFKISIFTHSFDISGKLWIVTLEVITDMAWKRCYRQDCFALCRLQRAGWRCGWGYLKMHRSFPYCGANHIVWQWEQNNSFWWPFIFSVKEHSLVITREGLILTLTICTTLQGWILCASLPAG